MLVPCDSLNGRLDKMAKGTGIPLDKEFVTCFWVLLEASYGQIIGLSSGIAEDLLPIAVFAKTHV